MGILELEGLFATNWLKLRAASIFVTRWVHSFDITPPLLFLHVGLCISTDIVRATRAWGHEFEDVVESELASSLLARLSFISCLRNVLHISVTHTLHCYRLPSVGPSPLFASDSLAQLCSRFCWSTSVYEKVHSCLSMGPILKFMLFSPAWSVVQRCVHVSACCLALLTDFPMFPDILVFLCVATTFSSIMFLLGYQRCVRWRCKWITLYEV